MNGLASEIRKKKKEDVKDSIKCHTECCVPLKIRRDFPSNRKLILMLILMMTHAKGCEKVRARPLKQAKHGLREQGRRLPGFLLRLGWMFLHSQGLVLSKSPVSSKEYSDFLIGCPYKEQKGKRQWWNLKVFSKM